MGAYIKKSCRKCGYVFQYMKRDPNLLKVGNPEIRCPRCGTLNIDKSYKEAKNFNIIDFIRYLVPQILSVGLVVLFFAGISYGIFYELLKIKIIFIPIVLTVLFTIYSIYLIIKNLKEEILDERKK